MYVYCVPTRCDEIIHNICLHAAADPAIKAALGIEIPRPAPSVRQGPIRSATNHANRTRSNGERNV